MADPLTLSLGAVIELLNQLIPLLKPIIAPELSDQIDKAIMVFRADRDAKRKALIDAVAAMDVAKINALIAELFG
jgi:hypothetical protein